MSRMTRVVAACAIVVCRPGAAGEAEFLQKLREVHPKEAFDRVAASGDISLGMIIAAALIEGFTFFGIVVALLLVVT